MQLRRLSGLERDKIESEYAELLKTIADLEDTDITAVINTIEITTYKEYKETH